VPTIRKKVDPKVTALKEIEKTIKSIEESFNMLDSRQ